MNMTFEEAKLYHYRLWNEIVKELPHNIDMASLYRIKNGVFEKLRFRGLVPKIRPRNCCYLCEYYGMICNDCPLNGCDLYDTLMDTRDVDEAVSLAETIRDIYKKEV